VDGHLGVALAVSNLDTTRSRERMQRVITLLEAALGQLHNQVHQAEGSLLEATSLLRQQIDPRAEEVAGCEFNLSDSLLDPPYGPALGWRGSFPLGGRLMLNPESDPYPSSRCGRVAN
jgi:hypothetical protein